METLVALSLFYTLVQLGILANGDINSEEDLIDYQQNHVHIAYHLQEFVDYKIEAGVMYYRIPNSEESGILSVTLKQFLSIVGNAHSTCMQLIEENPRAVLVKKSLVRQHGSELNKVLALDEEFLLEPIGNHCRGTVFLEGNHLIDEKMIEGFNRITERIEGVYFCRYDLKCSSIEDLKAGRNIKVLEINGARADPAHIYDSSASIFQKYKVILRQ